MPKASELNPKPAAQPAIFVRRLTSSVILWTLVLVALFSGHEAVSSYVFLLVMLVIAGVGLMEFFDLIRKRDLVCFKGFGIAGGLVLVAGGFAILSGRAGPDLGPERIQDFEIGMLILFVLGLCARQLWAADNPAGFVAISTTLLGLLYVPWLLNFLQKIYFFPGVEGSFFIFYFILVSKFSDLGAYVTGSLIGKHKMMPRVSPNKTWEGFAGAILISTGASLLLVFLAGERLFGMNWLHAIVLGVILGVMAVVGDLIESLFKREAGAKDSGRLFPGIGGVLDLVDSLLFNAPLMYLYMRYILAA